MYKCNKCNYKFKSNYLLQKHLTRQIPCDNVLSCKVCGLKFTNHLYLTRHQTRKIPCKDQDNKSDLDNSNQQNIEIQKLELEIKKLEIKNKLQLQNIQLQQKNKLELLEKKRQIQLELKQKDFERKTTNAKIVHNNTQNNIINNYYIYCDNWIKDNVSTKNIKPLILDKDSTQDEIEERAKELVEVVYNDVLYDSDIKQIWYQDSIKQDLLTEIIRIAFNPNQFCDKYTSGNSVSQFKNLFYLTIGEDEQKIEQFYAIIKKQCEKQITRIDFDEISQFIKAYVKEFFEVFAKDINNTKFLQNNLMKLSYYRFACKENLPTIEQNCKEALQNNNQLKLQ